MYHKLYGIKDRMTDIRIQDEESKLDSMMINSLYQKNKQIFNRLLDSYKILK